MTSLSSCRICLSKVARRDISNLKCQQSDKTGSEIMLFCLSIHIEADSKVSTKLCLKCFRNIMAFNNFKLLAIKNDAYLKNIESNLHIKTERTVDENLKSPGQSMCDNKIPEIESDDKFEIKTEPDNEDGVSAHHSESDDELLSDIKKIKYEFVVENSECKENDVLKINEKSTKKLKSKAHVCEHCGKRVRDLKNHRSCHNHEDGSARIPCDLCEKTFSTHRTKNKHVNRIHLGVKTPCPICHKGVKNLKQHTLRLHNKSQLRYECSLCERRFLTKVLRNEHMLFHTKDRPYACDKCDKRFRQLATMNQHKLQIHDKVPSHLCQFCSKSFYTVKYLQRHLQTHSSVRAYKCSQCDKAFKCTKALKNHMYTHSEEKAFECTICHMKFAHPGYLRSHTLTHTREKQYPCKYCGVKFHRSDHRKRHEFTAHEKHLLSK